MSNKKEKEEKLQCLKCGHDIDLHKIMVIGNWEYMIISCQAQGEDYHDACECEAGFGKVRIKKEFSLMKE